MKNVLLAIAFFLLINHLLYFRVTVPFSLQISGVASKTSSDLISRADMSFEESRSRSSSGYLSVSPTGASSTDPYMQQLLSNMSDASLQQEMRAASTGMFWPYFLINLVENRLVPTIYFGMAFLVLAGLCRHVFQNVSAIALVAGYSLVAFLIVPGMGNYIFPPLVRVDESILEFVWNSHSLNRYGYYSFVGLLIGQLFGSFFLTAIVAAPEDR